MKTIDLTYFWALFPLMIKGKFKKEMKYLVKEISEGNCDITLLPENLNDRNLLAETSKNLREDFQKEIQFHYEDALRHQVDIKAAFISLNFDESNYPKRVNVNYQIIQN